MPAIPDKTQAATDLVLGKRIGDYVVSEKLAAGTTGIVYRAEHEATRKPVVIKVLHTALSHRANDDLSAVRSIKCPAIVEAFQSGKLPDGRSWIMMDYLEGETLEWRLHREEKLGPAEVVRIAEEIALALQAAHAWTIPHRDLKPSNVFLVSKPGTPPQVRLLDFGLGPTSTRSDLQGLGDMCFLMLTGKHLEPGAQLPSKFVPGVPRELDDLIWELSDREPPLKEVCESLTRLSMLVDKLQKPAAPPAPAPAPGPAAPLKQPKQPRSLVVPLIAVGVVLIGVAVTAVFWPQPAEQLPMVVPLPEDDEEDDPELSAVPADKRPPGTHKKKQPKPAAPKAPPKLETLDERIDRLDAKLRKKAGKIEDVDGMALNKLSKLRMRLAGSPDSEERKAIQRDLDDWERSYLK
jgi:serine/threonine protein kinase